MKILPFQDSVFYSIEKAIKTYRRYAQNHIQENKLDLTVNQSLLLNLLSVQPDISQNEMAIILFKDLAAITRMMELLVKRGLVKRHPHPTDRRKHTLRLTKMGKSLVTKLIPITKIYRAAALKGFTQSEVDEFQRLLEKLIINCKIN